MTFTFRRNSEDIEKKNFNKTFEQNGYLVEVSTNQNIADLHHIWLQLEKNNDTPFFLTWHWISCWIKSYLPEIITTTARYNNQIVAVGLFTKSVEKRHFFIKSNQLRLHQMGNILKDQIWMEYNDFICEEAHKEKAVNACLDVLLNKQYNWDEIILSMMSGSRAEYIAETQILANIEQQRPSYALDLSIVRSRKKDYLQLLSANTRYQIRHSIKLYESKYGSLKLY